MDVLDRLFEHNSIIHPDCLNKALPQLKTALLDCQNDKVNIHKSSLSMIYYFQFPQVHMIKYHQYVNLFYYDYNN